MLSPRDIDRLKARTKALRQLALPPDLKIRIFVEGEVIKEIPTNDHRTMDVIIENQRELI